MLLPSDPYMLEYTSGNWRLRYNPPSSNGVYIFTLKSHRIAPLLTMLLNYFIFSAPLHSKDICANRIELSSPIQRYVVDISEFDLTSAVELSDVPVAWDNDRHSPEDIKDIVDHIFLKKENTSDFDEDWLLACLSHMALTPTPRDGSQTVFHDIFSLLFSLTAGVAARGEHIFLCPVCQRYFSASTSSAKYCSKDCKSLFYKRQQSPLDEEIYAVQQQIFSLLDSKCHTARKKNCLYYSRTDSSSSPKLYDMQNIEQNFRETLILYRTPYIDAKNAFQMVPGRVNKSTLDLATTNLLKWLKEQHLFIKSLKAHPKSK